MDGTRGWQAHLQDEPSSSAQPLSRAAEKKRAKKQRKKDAKLAAEASSKEAHDREAHDDETGAYDADDPLADYKGKAASFTSGLVKPAAPSAPSAQPDQQVRLAPRWRLGRGSVLFTACRAVKQQALIC